MKLRDKGISIPACIFKDGLPDKAFILLAFLFSRSTTGGRAEASYKEMMEGTGIVSRNTVSKALRTIMEHGWFDHVRRQGSRPTLFYLRVPEQHERYAPRKQVAYNNFKARRKRLGIHI